MKRPTFLILLLLPVVVAGIAWADFALPKIPKELNAAVDPSYEAYSPQKGMGYLEAWAFWAKGADGTTVIAQFAVTNTGFQKRFPAYNVTVIPAGKGPVNVYQEFDSKTLVASTDKLDTRFKNVHVTGRHPDYRIKLTDSKVNLDLKFTATCPSLKLAGDGKIRIDNKGHFFRSVILAPRANVSGTVKVGDADFQFSGKGYVDHILQNMISFKFSRRWYVLRFIGENTSVAHMGFFPSSQRKGQYIGQTTVASDGKIRHVSFNGTVTSNGTKVDTVSQYKLPQKVMLKLDEPGCKLELGIPIGNYFERIEVLGRINIVAKKIISLVARPYIFRSDNSVKGKIDLGEGEKEISGNALGQMIILN